MTHDTLQQIIAAETVLAEELENPHLLTEWQRPMPARAIANRLLLYSVEQGLGQSALARRLGVSRSTITRLAAGDTLPSLGSLARIARGLDIEILVDIKPIRQQKSQEKLAVLLAG